MDVEQYLKDVLSSQSFKNDDPELVTLQEKRNEVEKILLESFPGVTIRYAGSHAKKTMIRACYDLDLACYFGHEDKQAGESLEEIRYSVYEVLKEHFSVVPKTSALRLEEGSDHKQYTHVDVVPGRYIDGNSGDVFLFQFGVEKNRQKTNLDTHIETIRDSELTDVIQLIKYWAHRQGFHLKTFILELLVIKILKSHKSKSLARKLELFWECLRDNIDDVTVEDPANPEGNDLMPVLNSNRIVLSLSALNTLQSIQNIGWEQVFGVLEEQNQESARLAAINRFAQSRTDGARPWSE